MWFVLCVTLLVSSEVSRYVASVHSGHGPQADTSRGAKIRTDLFYNHSGWSSKPYVYLLGWQYSTIASGYVSAFGPASGNFKSTALTCRMLLLSKPDS
jgi:hypothetical protein